MKSISILHPFTPESAGMLEKSISTSHSQPHVKALSNIATLRKYSCSIQYFTSRLFPYSLFNSNLEWNFFPVTYKINGDHKKWRKQYSNALLRQYRIQTPDVTIINMAAQCSPFSFEVSKLIRSKKKRYISMIGGRHYHDNKWIREYYLEAHHIIVHTETQKSEMEKMDLFKGKTIKVMPLGVDCSVFKPDPSKVFSMDPCLIFVGRISEIKRIHIALEVVKKLFDMGLHNTELNIIGPVASKVYYRELKSIVERQGISKNVNFISEKEHNELPHYFAKADLTLLPSFSESFGMVIVESMACGTPVAALSGSGGPEEIISSGKDGLICNSGNYIEDVCKLLQSKELIKSMREKARSKILNKYSMEVANAAFMESVEFALNDNT